MRLTACPVTGLPLASFKTTVKAACVEPSAVRVAGVVTEKLELARTGAPAMKVTELPVTDAGVTKERIFASAFLEAKVQVDTPEALEAEQAE